MATLTTSAYSHYIIVTLSTSAYSHYKMVTLTTSPYSHYIMVTLTTSAYSHYIMVTLSTSAYSHYIMVMLSTSVYSHYKMVTLTISAYSHYIMVTLTLQLCALKLSFNLHAEQTIYMISSRTSPVAIHFVNHNSFAGGILQNVKKKNNNNKKQNKQNKNNNNNNKTDMSTPTIGIVLQVAFRFQNSFSRVIFAHHNARQNVILPLSSEYQDNKQFRRNFKKRCTK